MRTAKVIGLGIFFSFVGFVMLLVISIMLGGIRIETGPSHAIGLSALVVGIIFNPLTWLVILVGFGAAFWVVRRPALGAGNKSHG